MGEAMNGSHITASADGAGLDRLTGCPAEEHVRWMMGQRQQGTPAADPDVILTHFAVTPRLAEAASLFGQLEAHGPHAVVEVTGWRTGSTGAVVAEFIGADGHAYEVHVAVASDGRLRPPRVQRALGGIEVEATRPGDLSTRHRKALFDVFDATYDDADHRYLDDQLDRFDSIGLATEEHRVVGFSIIDVQTVDLPVLGPQVCSRAGLSCVLPHARRGGLMTSMAIASAQQAALEARDGLFSIGGSRYATPASFTMALRRHEARPWPPPDDPFALYDHPTPTQVSVARALARNLGGTDYDPATGVCIGRGRPIGTPIVEPETAPDVEARFAPVDRNRGDSLLWIAWVTPPPAAWFR